MHRPLWNHAWTWDSQNKKHVITVFFGQLTLRIYTFHSLLSNWCTTLLDCIVFCGVASLIFSSSGIICKKYLNFLWVLQRHSLSCFWSLGKPLNNILLQKYFSHTPTLFGKMQKCPLIRTLLEQIFVRKINALPRTHPDRHWYLVI